MQYHSIESLQYFWAIAGGNAVAQTSFYTFHFCFYNNSCDRNFCVFWDICKKFIFTADGPISSCFLFMQSFQIVCSMS